MTLERIGPYKVVTKLGEGGMGEVFEALHEAIEKRVAIKILHPEYARTTEFASRFFNEARAVNRVDHPGLVQVNDYGQLPDGTAYIVMELLKGETLGARIKRLNGVLPLQESMRLLRQVGSALAAAHSKGIVHRDLKPDNIMMVPDPETAGGERAKLLDFGIAKLVEDKADEHQVRTRTNQLIGTPRYMSPEQCRGAGGVDDRTDVYSLGVILYQLLARRPPFVGAGSGELMAMHIYEAPPPLDKVAPETPEQLINMTYRMLSKDKAQRPSMREVVAELEALSGSPSRPLDDQSGRMSQSSIPRLPADRSSPSGSALIEVSTGGFATTSATTDLPGVPGGAPTPTAPTLGSATGQKEGPVTSPAQVTRSKVPLLAGGAVVIAGLIVTVVIALRSHPTPSISPAEITAPVSGTAAANGQNANGPKLVRWNIDSDPNDSEVVRVTDGAILGRTPWVREQPPTPGQMKVRLRHAGYAERLLNLDSASDVSRKETLDPLANEPAKAPVTSAATPSTPAGVGKKPPNLKKKPVPNKPKPEEKIEIE